MSNIEIHRTDPIAVFFAKANPTLRGGLATLVLLVFWISFQPFLGQEAGLVAENKSGNLINQLGYTGLFGIVTLACLTLVQPAALTRLISFPWLLALIILLGSTFMAPDPAGALRAYLFTTFGIITAAGAIVLPRSADQFCKVLLVAGGGTLALCYAGLFIYPVQAIHQAVELESEHAGMWRGVFTHKNIAGPIMAAFVFAGIYIFRRGWRWAGGLLALAGFVFVMNTGAKTSVALVPLTMLMVLAPAMMGIRGGGALAVVAAIVGTHALTLGTVFVPMLDDILRSFNETTTFTGRIEIWRFAKDYVYLKPLMGYGFDGFWETATTLEAEQYFDQTWDPRKIIHGHNGFLDMALQFGIPTLGLVFYLVVLAPAIAYVGTLKTRENILMADFFFMIVAFTGMNSALESFYFQRSDPVWLTLIIAVFGLRMTSRFSVSST